jgi:hypothetical protein
MPQWASKPPAEPFRMDRDVRILARIFALVGAALMLVALLPPPPASASVICVVRKNGRFICTRYCPDGYLCDLENNKCLPGPAVQRNLARLTEEARKATLASNQMNRALQKQANRNALGYDRGQYYYNWSGDPRVIPTPRYRGSGSIPSNSSAAMRMSPASRPAPVSMRRSGTTIRVSSQVSGQLLALVSAARAFPPTDPNRRGAVKLLRDFARTNKLPIDVDELLDCDRSTAEQVAYLRPYQMRWRVPDIEAEVEKQGLCASANSDTERDACRSFQFGQIVMKVEPDLRALCKLQENDFQERDIAALGECAERKFRNAWARRDGVVLADTRGNVVSSSARCPVIESVESLRDRLRRLLSEAGMRDDVPESAETESLPADQTAAPPAPPRAEAARPPPSDDDPFCAFIARKAVRGELTAGGGSAIPDYCRSAVDAAKSCAEQKCSTADVIDEQDRNNAQKPLPWGSDDNEAISKLQRDVQ